jgi:hypothetical protein
MDQRETKVGGLCVSRQTLYRHVDPKGRLRPDREKLLESRRRASTIADGANINTGTAATSSAGA